MADSNKIFLPLRLASPKFVFSEVPRRRASEARVRSGHWGSCTRTSVFRKGNVAESGFSFSRSAARGGRRHSPQPSPRKRGEGSARVLHSPRKRGEGSARVLHSIRHSVGRQRGKGSRATKGASARRPPRGAFPRAPDRRASGSEVTCSSLHRPPVSLA
jgi:hypothetical protein